MDAEETNSETGAQGAPATDELTPSRLSGDDSRLVELVTAVLVDPSVHTDLRMRLCGEIPKLIRTARESATAASQPQTPPAGDDRDPAPPGHGPDVAV